MPERAQGTLLTKRVRFDLESIIRNIMLRRLFALRQKFEKNETETPTKPEEKTTTTNENNNNTSSECKESDKNIRDNNDNIQEASNKLDGSTDDNKTHDENSTSPEKDKLDLEKYEEVDLGEGGREKVDNQAEKTANLDHSSKESVSDTGILNDAISKENSEERSNEEGCKEKTDHESVTEKSEAEVAEKQPEEKESEHKEHAKELEVSQADTQDRSGMESDSSPSEGARSDQDEKDSGIEKGGDSPTPPQESQSSFENVKGILGNQFEMSKTTLQLLTPVSLKPRRIRSTKSDRRPKGMADITDLESELSETDSSPEKTPRYHSNRKNMTVSYLSFPQRFVRSSLAVEARLSQWRKEIVPGREAGMYLSQGRGGIAAPSAARKGILKTTEEVAFKMAEKGKNKPQSRRRAQRKGLWDSSDSGLSDEESRDTRMPIRKIYHNKTALRKRIDDLEGLLATMTQQKQDLEQVIEMLRCWSAELREVERTKLGVPYIRSVKKVLKYQNKSLCDKKSEFNFMVSRLKAAQIPCIDDVTKHVLQLRKEVDIIVQDKRRYNVQSIEHVRHLQGRVTGTCTAIRDVYYEAE